MLRLYEIQRNLRRIYPIPPSLIPLVQSRSVVLSVNSAEHFLDLAWPSCPPCTSRSVLAILYWPWVAVCRLVGGRGCVQWGMSSWGSSEALPCGAGSYVGLRRRRPVVGPGCTIRLGRNTASAAWCLRMALLTNDKVPMSYCMDSIHQTLCGRISNHYRSDETS